MTTLVLAVFWITIVGVAGYVFYRARLRYITLLPYQRGVLFVRGFPSRDVGPGKHRVRTGAEFLVFLDTRPISFRADNQAVVLQDGATTVYSISASAEVKDARRAIYSARNYNHVPPYMIRRSARKILNLKSSGMLMAGREGVEECIAEDAKPRLAAAGFALVSFRLSQLAVAPPQEGSPADDGHGPQVSGRLPN